MNYTVIIQMLDGFATDMIKSLRHKEKLYTVKTSSYLLPYCYSAIKWKVVCTTFTATLILHNWK